jgi:hypothetical protein
MFYLLSDVPGRHRIEIKTQLRQIDEALVVDRSDGSGIIAKDLKGAERMVSPTQARSFSVQERSAIEISPGDRLLLT